MIILSQNTLLAIRRAVLVNNDYSCATHLWEASEYVLAANETLNEKVEEYLESGRSWDEVKAAKAALAKSVFQFEAHEDGVRIRARLDAVSPGAKAIGDIHRVVVTTPDYSAASDMFTQEQLDLFKKCFDDRMNGVA